MALGSDGGLEGFGGGPGTREQHPGGTLYGAAVGAAAGDSAESDPGRRAEGIRGREGLLEVVDGGGDGAQVYVSHGDARRDQDRLHIGSNGPMTPRAARGECAVRAGNEEGFCSSRRRLGGPRGPRAERRRPPELPATRRANGRDAKTTTR